LLTTIPGVGEQAARGIIAEIGVDMGRFPTSGHLISWAGLCPRNDESAGKRLHAQFHRLRARRGAKKAIGAVAASILTAACHMLKDGPEYQDLGAAHFDQRPKQSQATRLLARLRNLGCSIDVRTVPA
jgi:hypothetical protein